MGAELSPPAGLPMWLCESTSPGMTVLPARSTVVAPPGIFNAPLAPTGTILPSVTTSVPFSMGAPAIGMMRALMNARVSADAPLAVASRTSAPQSRADTNLCMGRHCSWSGVGGATTMSFGCGADVAPNGRGGISHEATHPRNSPCARDERRAGRSAVHDQDADEGRCERR